MTPPSELRALLAKATEGPWVATERSGYQELLAPDTTCDWYGHKNSHAVAYIDTELDEDEQEANAALIVALRNNASALLDEIEGHSAALAQAKAIGWAMATAWHKYGIGWAHLERVSQGELLAEGARALSQSPSQGDAS